MAKNLTKNEVENELRELIAAEVMSQSAGRKIITKKIAACKKAVDAIEATFAPSNNRISEFARIMARLEDREYTAAEADEWVGTVMAENADAEGTAQIK